MQTTQQLTSTLDNWDFQVTKKRRVDKLGEEFQVFPGSIGQSFYKSVVQGIHPCRTIVLLNNLFTLCLCNLNTTPTSQKGPSIRSDFNLLARVRLIKFRTTEHEPPPFTCNYSSFVLEVSFGEGPRPSPAEWVT